ncbi:hypothetical protein [Dactylosporangium salmoneum]
MSQAGPDVIAPARRGVSFVWWYPLSLLLYAAVVAVAVMVDVSVDHRGFGLGPALAGVVVSSPGLVLFGLWSATVLPFVWLLRRYRWPARLLCAALLMALLVFAGNEQGRIVSAFAQLAFALLVPLPRPPQGEA